MSSLIVYHGGPRLIEPRKGYVSKCKKDRFQFGTGLYTTLSRSQAQNYGRVISELTLELDPNKDALNVRVCFSDAINRLGWYTSKAACKRITEAFKRHSNKDDITLQHFVSLVVNYDPKIHLYSNQLNSMIIEFGATHTTEYGFNKMILVHDFNIIKQVKKG